jgi:serine/threonine-protein kinase
VPAPGSPFGSYLLSSILGEGATGVVFRAVAKDGNEVALKILRPELIRDDVYRRRFEHEVRAAQGVEHPNVVPPVDFGEAEGHPFIAFAYIPEAKSLRSRIKDRGRLETPEVVRLARQLAGGIDALHQRGIVHRDIKPANIILTRDGDALLTDFGLAKGRAYTVLTRPGQVLGTPDYIAPELIRGLPAETPSDIYSFGCTVFECVCGEPPFAGVGLVALGIAHLEEAPPNPGANRPDLPADFCAAVLQALEKEPSERPATATAYARMLGFASRST